jgi:membrane-bound lytic murein transglycosylase B
MRLILAVFLGLSGVLAVGSQPAIADPVPVAPQETAKFTAFVQDFRTTALKEGIAPAIYDQSMSGISLNPRVEQLNLQQPEFVRPIWEYLDGAVSPKRVTNGEALLGTYGSALAGIEQRFGVAKEILAAIWGIESDYGVSMGSFNMFEALATLAYDGPRADFGRRELIAAFKMEQQESYRPADMTSSWAGAFGQTQFMPSEFLQYAVDEDGSGKPDLWRSPADALASSANLLAAAGWQRQAPWGYEVWLPQGFAYEEADLDKTKSLTDWSMLGVTSANGAALPRSEAQASIIVPAGARGPAFIVFDNFRMVLKYNNAVSYALAVCLLADRLKGAPPVVHSWPRDETVLNHDEILAFQSGLKKLGYDPGDADGILGRKARAALRAWQKANGRVPDGFATEEILTRIEQSIAAGGG